MTIVFLFLKHLRGQSLFRLVATILAVILATFILLATLSLGQGWLERNHKQSLLSSLTADSEASPQKTYDKNSVYISSYQSQFETLTVEEIGIYTTAQSLPDDIKNLPEKSTIWVTPALKKAINTNPDLAQRYAGYNIQTSFPQSLSPSSDALSLLYQLPKDTITTSKAPLRVVSSSEIQRLYTDRESSTLANTALLLAGAILITPILLLITEIAKIGITQREKRYAALSLAGATKGQIRLLLAAETIPPSLIGAFLGVFIFIAIGLPFLATLPVAGDTFWHADLLLPAYMYIIICAIVVTCSALASLQSVASINLSPLAASRTDTDVHKVRSVTILPLLIGTLGLYLLSLFSKEWHKSDPAAGSIALTIVLLLIIASITFAGPYIVSRFAVVIGVLAKGAPSTLAARRLLSKPRKVYRSINGLVLTLFVGSLLATLLGTIHASANTYIVETEKAASSQNTSFLQLPLQVTVSLPNADKSIVQKLQNTPELSNLISDSYTQQLFTANAAAEDSDTPTTGNYYSSCTAFKQRTNLPCDETVRRSFIVTPKIPETIDGKADFSFEPLFTPVDAAQGTINDESYILVAKDRQSLSRVVDIVYTATSSYHMRTAVPVTVEYTQDTSDDSLAVVRDAESLITAIFTIALITASLGICVSVLGGVFERKRTFMRLRILGARTSTLAISLLAEILLPLSLLLVIAIALGIFVCYCVLSITGLFEISYMSFSLPGMEFWVALAIATLLIMSILLLIIPILAKLTNFDEIRSE